MVTQAEAKIHRVGPRHTIYLAKDLVEDSTFPFSANEDLTVRIEGGALIIDKTGKSGYRLPDMEALPSRNQHVMERLDVRGPLNEQVQPSDQNRSGGLFLASSEWFSQRTFGGRTKHRAQG